MTGNPSDLQASFCAALVDEWQRGGVCAAVVSPGSRSTPLALAIAASGLPLHVVLDERSAAFVALGIGRATGRPAVLACTSGTAAAQYHAAVVEADLDRVPMIVCTADRPPELHGIGAAQTIDQHHLYSGSVRWYCDPGVAGAENRSAWRSVGARSVIEAIDGPPGPGPVHLNLPFREPLVGVADWVPDGRADGEAWHRSVRSQRTLATEAAEKLRARIGGTRGVIVAGGGTGDPTAVLALAARLGWPVLADPRSGCRLPEDVVISTADAFLRDTLIAEQLRPDVVLRFGGPWASKVLGQWLDSAGLDMLVDPHSAWVDPRRSAESVLHADTVSVCDSLGNTVPAPEDWARRWRSAERSACAALGRLLDPPDSDQEQFAPGLREPAVARALLGSLPDGAQLVVSSSMPVRDVEWFGAPRRGVRVHVNRGANGIDGVVSTILGVAAAGVGPTTGLLGDLAFLHDIGALVWAANGTVDATIVVVDNGGGGIFEFLPQASSSSVGRERFEMLFGTPQRVDVAVAARGFGHHVTVVDNVGALVDSVRSAQGRPGVDIVVIRTDRVANVGGHDTLNAAVIASVRSAWGLPTLD